MHADFLFHHHPQSPLFGGYRRVTPTQPSQVPLWCSESGPTLLSTTSFDLLILLECMPSIAGVERERTNSPSFEHQLTFFFYLSASDIKTNTRAIYDNTREIKTLATRPRHTQHSAQVNTHTRKTTEWNLLEFLSLSREIYPDTSRVRLKFLGNFLFQGRGKTDKTCRPGWNFLELFFLSASSQDIYANFVSVKKKPHHTQTRINIWRRAHKKDTDTRTPVCGWYDTIWYNTLHVK